jgi:protein-L-isoaspartate O-methyltransferase
LSGETLDRGHFDGLYEQSADPYGFTSRWYETRKYAVSMAMLPWPRYRSAFEPGCSIGVLTAQLAGRCDALLSCDGSATAVATARERTARFPQVTVEQRLVPADWPTQGAPYDLIVLSELLYYLGDEDLARAAGLAMDSLAEGGTLLAVHWRRPVPFHPQTGDGAHAALARRPELTLLADHREPDFLAQVYLRAPAGADPAELSVAAAEGLT